MPSPAAAQHQRGSKRRRGEPDDGEDGEEEEDGEEGEESGSESSGSGEGEEQGESEEEEDEEKEEEQEGHGPRRRRKGGAAVDPATLDREPGDDNDGPAGPWPPPPPPPEQPQGQEEEGRGQQQGGQGVAQGAARWDQLKAAAAARGGNLHLDIGICAVERGGEGQGPGWRVCKRPALGDGGSQYVLYENFGGSRYLVHQA